MLSYATLKAVQEDHMFDVCNINKPMITYNSLGEEIKSYTTVSGVSFGMEYLGGVTEYKGLIFPTPVDAIARFPLETEIDVVDTITVTNFKGTEVAETYQVISYPRKGSSAIRVNLKRITV